MADVPGVSPDGEFRGPHGIGDEWISFELRMRKRRLAKCLLRADLAIEDQDIDGARLALSEARDLDPESIEAGALEARLEALVGARVSDRRRRRIRLAAIASAAGLLLLGGSAVALGVRYWKTAPSPAPVSTVSAVEPGAAGLTGPASLPAAKPRKPRKLEVVFETVRVPEATPRIVEDMPRLPSVPGPPVADADPEPDPVVLAVNRGPNPPPPPQTPEVGSELPLDALPTRPVAAPPVRVAAPSAAATDTTARSDMSAAGTGPIEPEPSPPRDESSVVREVLERYEHAYSSLDAVAASAVWPGVNKDALSRAFDGLASQSVSLGSCDVAIEGPAARATCSGSATWEPKVGGGVHTAPRRWNFELRKKGGGWQIERAVTR